LNNRF